MSELSVLMVNYNSWGVCAEALRSLDANRPCWEDGATVSFEVIVVDNCSPQGDPQAEAEVSRLLDEMGGKLILHGRNGGYSEGINLAYAHSSGRYLLAVNPDVLFPQGCIDRLLHHLRSHPETGIAVPAGFWDQTMTVHLPPNILPTLGDLLVTTVADVRRATSRRYSLTQAREARRVWEAVAAEQDVELKMISGCCFLLERSLIDEIDLLDERFPLYFEDADLCMRVRKAGRRIVQVGGARLVHLYNRSGQTDHDLAMSRYWISRRRFYRKWYGIPGAWMYGLCSWFLRSRLGRRLAVHAPHGPVEDFGTVAEKPVIHLPRRCDRFMLQVSMDARFYLSGAVFGSGDTWTPSDEMFSSFGNAAYFCRGFDLSDTTAVELMSYRFNVAHPQTAAADSAAPLEGVHDCS